MTARRLDVTPAEYLSDPCSVPSLSTSIAHTLIDKSPAHAYARHPRLGNQPDDPTPSTDNGSLIHRLVLGKGQDIVIVEADDFRTKLAREVRDEAIACGKLPVIERKYAEAETVAEIHKRKLWDEYGIALVGESEVCLEFEEAGNDGPVLCRVMIDHLHEQDAVQYEYKTIRSADPRTCSRHSVFYGYDIGHAARVSAFAKLHPEIEGRDDFIFIFAECEPPYAVSCFRPDGGFRQMGESRWLRAVQIWEQCMSTGKWPSYLSEIGLLEVPGWALAEEEMEEMR